MSALLQMKEEGLQIGYISQYKVIFACLFLQKLIKFTKHILIYTPSYVLGFKIEIFNWSLHLGKFCFFSYFSEGCSHN